MKLTLEALDFTTLKLQIVHLCHELGIILPSTHETSEAELTSPETVKETKKRGRKPHVIEEQPAKVVEPPEPVSGPVISEELALRKQVADAIKKVNTNKGMEVARDLVVNQFKRTRISELTVEQLPEFLKACEEVLNS